MPERGGLGRSDLRDGPLALSEIEIELVVIHSSHKPCVQAVLSMCPLHPGWEGCENAANTRKYPGLCRVLTTAGLLQACSRTEMHFIWELQVRVFREHIASATRSLVSLCHYRL